MNEIQEIQKLVRPRDIQRWFPIAWEDIAGNCELVEAWKSFKVNGPVNLITTGPSRTGKTRINYLGIQAALCPNPLEDWSPCMECTSCKDLLNGKANMLGFFTYFSNSNYSYFMVDCEKVASEELREILLEVRSELGDFPVIVYLDEISALCRRGLDAMLLKAIDETPAVWIASAITVKRRNKNGKIISSTGLSEAFLNRFALKIGTTVPREPELKIWIKNRCLQFAISIEAEPETIPLMIQRCRHRPGFVLQILAVAASRGRKLTLDLVQRFNFQTSE